MTVDEIEAAKLKIISIVQQNEFSKEIGDLKRSSFVDKSSPLLTLNPFVAEKGILRVKGRIANANISYDSKHPIILPSKSNITQLIVRKEH